MREGWFEIPGVQRGHRLLTDQLKGLGPLLDHVREHRGRVCELGCAEGLILKVCADAGARDIAGLEVSAQAVEEANRQLQGAIVKRHDLNEDFTWPIDADVVLMLAILHKLRDPGRLVQKVLEHQPGLIVIRLPKETPGFVKDRRSGGKPIMVGEHITRNGYELSRVERGHFDEWTGYFEAA